MVRIGVEIIRVYEDPGRRRGEHRVLIDRLWPRGVRKEALDHDEWAKDVAPSTELRRWYGHDPERFAEFSRRYRSELRKAPGRATVERLREVVRPSTAHPAHRYQGRSTLRCRGARFRHRTFKEIATGGAMPVRGRGAGTVPVGPHGLDAAAPAPQCRRPLGRRQLRANRLGGWPGGRDRRPSRAQPTNATARSGASQYGPRVARTLRA